MQSNILPQELKDLYDKMEATKRKYIDSTNMAENGVIIENGECLDARETQKLYWDQMMEANHEFNVAYEKWNAILREKDNAK